MADFSREDAERIAAIVPFVERMMRNPRERPARGAVFGPTHIRRFELTENLAFGGNATAYLLKLSGGSYAADSSVEFEVYDPFSKFRQTCKPTGQDGARGYAWRSQGGRWEIIEMQHQARWIKFVVNDGSGFATTDASATVDGVVYIDGYEPDMPITTVYNTDESGGNYKFEGDDNDEGEALYDPANDKYWIEQMECP